jgi:hypothetical protein
LLLVVVVVAVQLTISQLAVVAAQGAFVQALVYLLI